MRAICPSCEATYEIPDRLIGTGRRLRCTNCAHEWTLLPAVAEAPEPPPAARAEAPRAAASAPPAPLSQPPPPPSAHPMLRRPPQLIDPPLPPVADDSAGFQPGGAALRAAWIGSVLAVAVALGALWTFRYEIAAAWPPAARLTGTPVGGG
jgi:predicted Zn finger-like uncharacterized protein